MHSRQTYSHAHTNNIKLLIKLSGFKKISIHNNKSNNTTCKTYKSSRGIEEELEGKG